MRSPLLFPFFADIESVKGIGAKTRQLIGRFLGTRVKDLVFHRPSNFIDRRLRPLIKDARIGDIVTLRLEIIEHIAPSARGGNSAGSRAPYRVVARDETGSVQLVFFKARRDYIEDLLPIASIRLVSGKLDRFGDGLQITHPDYIVPLEREGDLPLLEAIYPLTMGLSGKMLRKAIMAALEKLPNLPEWLSADLMKREGFPDFKKALQTLHQNFDEPEAQKKARRRLAYDELFANQLALAFVREQLRRKRGRALIFNGRLAAKIREALPYSLTSDQEKTIAEINADLKSNQAMLRLLQGDVGSGKTIVAFLALASAIEAGGQGILVAPTEILALQHYESLGSLAEKSGIRLGFLAGRVKGKARETLLAALAAGEIDLLIGTHAIFQDPVVFKNLALAIIDEQHRFGVAQRASLASKAKFGLDFLGMTATPIPRTLTMTVYGDMDVSRLTEKPPGRIPVDTRVMPVTRLPDLLDGLQRAISGGARVYWVCPLVEEDETSDLQAAEARAVSLESLFKKRVGLVHGRMKSEAKDAVIAAFQSGAIDILVATTVIEVGVNVPEASIMVVEQAERFGLAQLHQLRGRVGRGAKASSCILLRGEFMSQIAEQRLKILRESEDGFLIAEEDLRLRGSGELMGTRQSGLPDFTFVDYSEDSDLMGIARDDARLVLAKTPDLSDRRGEALKLLLNIFERDQGIQLMKAGG